MRVRLFDIQRYSVQDGPGIRTSVFMKGCPLRCAWCHNPESQQSKDQLLYYQEKCCHCGLCAGVCPSGAHTMVRGKHRWDRSQCTYCFDCVGACPAHALEKAGYELTVEDLLTKIARDRIFYDESGGGVTFSGGEPFAQPQALEAINKACQEQGIHTAVETSLMTKTKTISRLLPHVNLWLVDVKAFSADLHKDGTGVDNEQILHNISWLASQIPEKIWIRIPLIPGFNDHEAECRAMGNYLSAYPFDRVEFMVYHDAGKGKYTALDRPYSYDRAVAPTAERVDELKHILRQQGVQNIV